MGLITQHKVFLVVVAVLFTRTVYESRHNEHHEAVAINHIRILVRSFCLPLLIHLGVYE